jgi:hypothetical protein
MQTTVSNQRKASERTRHDITSALLLIFERGKNISPSNKRNERRAVIKEGEGCNEAKKR